MSSGGLSPRWKDLPVRLQKVIFSFSNLKCLLRVLKRLRKIKSFGALLEGDALIWLRSLNNCSWEKLEQEFVKVWCIHLSPTQAMSEVVCVKQQEDESVCLYISKFEGFKRFFVNAVTEETVIDLFLQNVRESLRHHVVAIKRRRLSWDEIIMEILSLNIKEPRRINAGNKGKSVLALSQGGSVPMFVSKADEEEVSKLRKRLQELEGKSPNKRTAENVCCFKCKKFGHFQRNCKSKKVDAGSEKSQSLGKANQK